jgi:DNA (cytosine-5)-methyltransferase 1
MTYYNEIDPFAAAWLRELINAHLIPDGHVDERSIVDVRADDLRGFRQCHFFAGIGGWAYALRLAGWPEDREVWTVSCPCQPFSSAGAQAGGDDPRDLWPAWCQLIRECRPVVVFGEQVEAAIGHGWLDRVCDDLEAEGYAVGACGLPGPCVGAYDIRQRLWFVAESNSGDELRALGSGKKRNVARNEGRGRPVEIDGCRSFGELADADSEQKQSCHGGSGQERMDAPWNGFNGTWRSGTLSELADPESGRTQSTQQPGWVISP